MVKTDIKIYFTGFWGDFNPSNNFIVQILNKNYNVILDSKSPDFLFFSCFSGAHLWYDCVKIEFLGENLIPDFNVCDYAVGFDYISFADRYLRYPLYNRYKSQDDKVTMSDDEAGAVFNRPGFCSFIYSNSMHSHPMRKQLLDAISKVGKVDSGGKYLNNLGYCVDNKLDWLINYKFSIACENSSKPGYTTEKLYNVLQAGAIPIYWGNPDVAKDFNSERFISVYDYDSLDELAEDVRKIAEDKKRFAAIVKQPWFCDNHKKLSEAEMELEDFLLSIVGRGAEQARRVPKYGYTKIYMERMRFIARFYPMSVFFTKAANKLNMLLGKNGR